MHQGLKTFFSSDVSFDPNNFKRKCLSMIYYTRNREVDIFAFYFFLSIQGERGKKKLYIEKENSREHKELESYWWMFPFCYSCIQIVSDFY